MVLTDLELTQASIELMSGLVSVMLAVIISIIKLKDSRSMRLLVRMFFIGAGLFAADSMAYLFRGNTDSFSLFMTRGSNFAVFSLNLALVIASTYYIYSVLQERQAEPSKVYLRVICLATLAAAVLLLLNLFTGWLYYFDEGNYYHRNTGWFVYTGFTLVSLAASCALVIRHRKKLSRAMVFSLLLFELFPIIAIVIQSLIYGIAIANIGIGITMVITLITYLIDWNRSEQAGKYTSQLRRSYETVVLFVIMAVSISASILSCVISIKRMSSEMSVSSSQVIGHIVADHIDNVFLRPVTVAETMSRDADIRSDMYRSAEDPTGDVTAHLADYLDSIRSGFGYQMVYVVCEQSKAYYTANGFVKTVDPENDPADAWYRDFAASGMPLMLEVDTDEANDWDLSVFVNAAITDAEGELLGVCGVGLSMAQLQEELARFESQYQIKITMASPGGLVLIDSDSSRIEQSHVNLPALESLSADEFFFEDGTDLRRLTKRMDDLGWYLIIEEHAPDNVDFMQIVFPSIVIFLVGLFMLTVAFGIIMIRERKIAAELVEKRRTSLSDELTGLGNRRAFEADCAKILEEGLTDRINVVMIDLNGLKETNDALGHQAGDELIEAAARCMQRSLGIYGSVYRTGGDEFYALMKCTPAEAVQAMESFEHTAAAWQGTLIHEISTAKGVVCAADHPELSLHDLIELADKRMYEDKNDYYRRTGKDRRRHS